VIGVSYVARDRRRRTLGPPCLLIVLLAGCAEAPGARDPPARPPPRSTAFPEDSRPAPPPPEEETPPPPPAEAQDLPDPAPEIVQVAAISSLSRTAWRSDARSLGALTALSRIELGRRAALARLHLGELRLERGEIGEARAAFESVGDLDPEAARLAAERLATLPEPPAPTPLFGLSKTWERAGPFDPALIDASAGLVALGHGTIAQLVEARTGRPLGRADLGEAVLAVGAGEGLAAFASQSAIFVLDPSGAARARVDASGLPGAGVPRALALRDDVLVVVRADESESYASVSALEPTGRVRFHSRILATRGAATRPVVATCAGSVAVATEDEVALFDLGTGEAAWVRATPEERERPARVSLEVAGRVLVGRGRTVDVLDAVTGRRLARHESALDLERWPRSVPLAPASCMAVVRPTGELVRALRSALRVVVQGPEGARASADLELFHDEPLRVIDAGDAFVVASRRGIEAFAVRR
jgi:hypothetical protein